LREGYDIEVVSGETSIPMKLDNVVSLKYMSEGMLREFKKPSKQRKLSKPTVNKPKRLTKLKSKMKTLIKENLLVKEEIVNKEHAGTMSKKEITSRDRIAKKVKATPIKKGDTAENAKYRLATYIELRKRGGKKEKPVKSGKKKKAKKDKE
jgi:hypothetical protein